MTCCNDHKQVGGKAQEGQNDCSLYVKKKREENAKRISDNLEIALVRQSVRSIVQGVRIIRVFGLESNYDDALFHQSTLWDLVASRHRDMCESLEFTLRNVVGKSRGLSILSFDA